MAAELSDKELRKELIAHGVNAGPITESTRSLYVKKLDTLLASNKRGVGSTSTKDLPGTSKAKRATRRRPNANSTSSTSATTSGLDPPIPGLSAKPKGPIRKLKTLSSDEESDNEVQTSTQGSKIRSSRSRADPPAPTRSTSKRVKLTRLPLSSSTARDEDEEDENADEEESEEGEEQEEQDVSGSLHQRTTSSWLSDRSKYTPSRYTASSSFSRLSTGPGYRTETSSGFSTASQHTSHAAARSTPSITSLGYVPSSEPGQRSRSSFLSRYLPSRHSTSFRSSTSRNDEFSDSDLDETTVSTTSKGINTSSFLDRSEYTSGDDGSQPLSRRSNIGSNSILRDPRWRLGDSTIRRRDKDCSTNDGNLTEEESIMKHFKTKEDTGAYRWAVYVSKLLLLTAAVFFVILALMYGTVIGIIPTFTESTDRPMISMLVCDKDKNQTEQCYEKEELEPAIELIDTMFDHLAYIAGVYDCGDHTITRDVPLTRMADHLRTDFKADLDASGSDKTKRYQLPFALELLAQRPEWNIMLKDKDKNLVETKNFKWTSVKHLESKVAVRSLWCQIRQGLEKVVYYLLLAVLVVVTVLLVVAYYRYRIRRHEEEMKKVFELVEQIIDILKTHHDRCAQTDGSQDSYLAVVHVRDMLIGVKQRRRMMPIWNKAVQFLAANESRIRTEMQSIKGEEFEVWRWLPPSVNGGKVWQGQAFGENQEQQLNLLPFTPTPCLKIRNMFDYDVECGPSWHVRIQDAILEKCGPGHNIVHIAVDKSSREGCVYVKCGSPDAAGRAYRALHGWWFDGNLVTVKFLRLERYHERFPGAKAARKPLEPSNSDRLSLSQPYHRSVLELS